MFKALKEQPKGLITASIANMGERFGFYTMMAILSLFIMSKFGLDEVGSGWIYSTFYFSIYAMALFGGIIADKTKKYKGTIIGGLVLMSVGYLLLAIPTTVTPDNKIFLLILTCLALFVISFGNGMFKGNLQAVVGQMYDNPIYSAKRDSGFSLFYMFINVGSIFAPFIAPGVRNWWLGKHGYIYNENLPERCHRYIREGAEMGTEAIEGLKDMAMQVSGTMPADLGKFAADYLDVFNTGFHYSFGIAVIAMIISLVVFIINKATYPDPANKKVVSGGVHQEAEMSVQEVRQRVYALLAVFGVVIFFWFSFHQNGLTLTYFAKDYVFLQLNGFSIGSWDFGPWQLTPEKFQSANPFFVVFLTPFFIGMFGWLKAKGKEPSTPMKIAIGMGIAASAFVVMAIGSYGLPLLSEVKAMPEGLPAVQRVTPFLLIFTYLILTIAELFISPLGISFVSKVAPPKMQGLMQGLWLLATGLGNQLLIVGAIFYKSIPIWATWTIFVGACVISMVIMLGMLKWLERVSK